MKVFLILLWICSAVFVPAMAQQSVTLSGRVVDEKGGPLPFVNVYLRGTTEGASTDMDGYFSFPYVAEGEVTLCASMLGYDEFVRTAPVARLQGVIIRMRPSSVALDDVVVVGSSYLLKGNSQWNGMSSVDVATETSSNGDLYKAIQMLPSTQASADSGELQVRGGSGRETQTYIDDMHVLFPYTATDENNASRGRYSPFMFEGINFAAGGYASEYADGLSGVLPLYTKDKSEISKCGISPSLIGLSGGGTRAFSKGSLSLNLDYWDLDLYNRLFPDRTEWIDPYRRFSAAAQFRLTPSKHSTFKSYVNYDRTTFRQLTDNSLRLGLKEDNVYFNTTFRTTTSNGWNLFAGAAFSYRDRHYQEVEQVSDTYQEREHELHLKTKASRRITSYCRLTFGLESFIRSFRYTYCWPVVGEKDNTAGATARINPVWCAGFASLVWNPRNDLFLEFSSRAAYNGMNREWNLAPRVAVNYEWKGVQFSAIAGRYTQLPENRWMVQDVKLRSEVCNHYVLGANYSRRGRTFRIELYAKEYNRLAWLNEEQITSQGYGRARGIDLFFKDSRPPIRHLDYSIAYSYGTSRRKYGEYGVLTVPPYFTEHNASLSLRWQLLPVNGIVSLTNRLASGRPYHNPDRPGLLNNHVKPYHSLDLGYTWLVSPKVIVYASASNLLCRHNVYGKENGRYIRTSSDHTFFLGIFITLSGKTAYDVSNF